jgi:hypothetical protein
MSQKKAALHDLDPVELKRVLRATEDLLSEGFSRGEIRLILEHNYGHQFNDDEMRSLIRTVKK